MRKNIVFGSILLLSGTLANILNLDLLPLVVYFCFVYGLFVFFLYQKFKSLRSILLSAEFIFGSVFFFYAIPSSIMFLLDGEVSRISFFTIDNSTMIKTLYLYFNIFVIFSAALFFIGKIKGLSFRGTLLEYRLNKKNSVSIAIDIIALGLTIYFYYLHFRNGFDVLGTYFHDMRELIQSGFHNFNSYVYLFMIPFSYVSIMDIISSKFKLNSRSIFGIVIVVAFWGLSLFTDRRNFVMLLVMLVVTGIALSKKIKVKSILIAVVAVFILLFTSFTRSGSQVATPQNVFYYMNGEFILTNYVTQYYVDKSTDFKYGSTYIIDTLTAPIPRFIYKDKPRMLSEQFQEDAGTNVAYAFNPVAEGLVNFGYVGATICVPAILCAFVLLSNWLSRYRLDYYAVMVASSIGFCRGIFSVSVFSVICICLVIYCMRRLDNSSRNKKRRNEES